MWLYKQERIDALNTPEERVLAAAIIQAAYDFRIPGYRDEIVRFFHGPLVGAAGLDGDELVKMVARRVGVSAAGYLPLNAGRV